jgi:protein TonB
VGRAHSATIAEPEEAADEPPAQELPRRALGDAYPAAAPREEDLFGQLVISGPRPRQLTRVTPISMVIHAVALALLILVPLYSVNPPPVERDYIRALLYDPPPPPPPPLPKGPGLTTRMKPSSSEPVPRPKPAFTAPVEAPPVQPAVPAPADETTGAGGSPTGSELGVPEGMEGGQVGGVVGGVPGGVLGGVIGGTGDIPVPVTNYDRAPRLLRLVKPEYPQEAFVKKIEGVVYVEILIDATGHVVRARVTRSVPLLDAAAVNAVRQWLFAPAVKGGQPVATVAMAPVTFRLY